MSAPAARRTLTTTAPRLVPLVVGRAPVAPVPATDVLALRGRVVIISATVGQGHEGAARELARRLRRRGVTVEVHDYLNALPASARHVLKDLYAPTVQYAPAAFDVLFRGLEHHGPLRRIANWVCEQAQATVARWSRDADVVVTTYPLGGQTLGALREQGRLTVPAVTYLTDPAAHATWCHPGVDHHLTVTRATADDAARYGVRARVTGPLAAPASRRQARAAVREELHRAQDAGAACTQSAAGLDVTARPRRHLRSVPGPPSGDARYVRTGRDGLCQRTQLAHFAHTALRPRRQLRGPSRGMHATCGSLNCSARALSQPTP